MPGPLRKHRRLKLLAGTLRPCRDDGEPPEVATLERLPPAPTWLNAAAANEWDRLAALLVANRMLSELQLGPLAVLCALFAQVIQQFEAGLMPKGATIGQFRGLAADLRLTTAATRLQAAPAVPPTNRFANNGRRPEGKDTK